MCKGGDGVIRQLFAALLAALLCLTLGGCTEQSAPQRATQEFLEKLSAGNLAGAEKLTVRGSLGMYRGNKNAAALYTPLFQSIQYAVGGSSVDGDAARVEVTITVADLEEVLLDASTQLVAQVLTTGEKPATGDFFSLLALLLEAPDLPRETYTATVRLVREEGRWKLDLGASSGFCAALGGGIAGLVSGA